MHLNIEVAFTERKSDKETNEIRRRKFLLKESAVFNNTIATSFTLIAIAGIFA